MRRQKDRRLRLFSRCCSALIGTQVVLAGIGISFTFHTQEAVAQANNNEQLADIAKSITVRIEGASSPASGVLIKKEGNRYTVITAWHVVKDQNPGEELAIYTFEDTQHQLERGSIKRVGNTDLAVLTFASTTRYQIARVNAARTRAGASIYLHGYPAATTTVPMRISRGTPGHIVAASENQSLNGYELMYATQMPSMTGMSGGSILDSKGNLIGIHARSETDQLQSVEEGIAIRTGTSQGVPISYFTAWISDTYVKSASTEVAREPKPRLKPQPPKADTRRLLVPPPPVPGQPRSLLAMLDASDGQIAPGGPFRYAITPERRALLNTIRFAEGTWYSGLDMGYHMILGGGLIDPLARHPGYGQAGAYALELNTWKAVSKRLGLAGFGPHVQDQGAIFLIQRRGALALADRGEFTPELAAKLAPEWASFLTLAGYSENGQPVKRYAALKAFYEKSLAQLKRLAEPQEPVVELPTCEPVQSLRCRLEALDRIGPKPKSLGI